MVCLTGKFHKVLILVRIVSKSKLVQLKLRLSLCSPFGFFIIEGQKPPVYLPVPSSTSQVIAVTIIAVTIVNVIIVLVL